MNVERLLTSLMRQAFRRVAQRGLNAGIDRAVGGGAKPEEMTPEERRQAKAAKQAAQRARQVAKLTRRMR